MSCFSQQSVPGGVATIPRAAARAAALFALCLAAATPAAAQQQPGPQQVAGRLAIDSVHVEGAVREKPDQVKALFGVRAGDTITFRDVQRGVRRLYASGQFKDVKVYAEGAPATGAVLVVSVTEQPFVAQVQFQGLQHVGQGAITDTVGLKSGQPYDPEKVAEAVARTRKLLADKGFQVRDIESKMVPLQGHPGEYRLVFDVQEGNRVSVAQISFDGNKVFTDDQLRGALDTKQEGFLWFRTGTYEQDQVRKDMQVNLPAFYGSHGYIDARVTGDTLVVDPHTGKARLVIRVDEGPQYRMASFDVRGNHHFSSEELKRYFEPAQGGLLSGNAGQEPVFDEAAFTQATDKLRQLYNNNGYLYAQVEPVIDRDAAKHTVDVAWQIQEGEPAYVNRVTIVGNTFTHERVIREQVLLLPGDVYNEDLLIQSYRNIMALGFFETPAPAPKIEPTDNGDVNITFQVKEKQTGSINFGTALGGGTGVAGFLGYDQPNLFGQAKAGHLRWEFGQYSNNLEASYSDPGIKGSLISGSLSLFSSRDRFIQFSEGQRRRTGASLRFGLPLPGDRSGRTRIFLGYSLARTTYQEFSSANEASSIFGLPPGMQSTFTVDLVRNTLDSPTFPTVGSRQELQADFNGGPLQGNAQFQKYTASGSWYVPVGQLGGSAPGGRPIRFTLGLTASAGSITGGAAGFPFERFFMGGVQFGESLRGYDETTVTPFGYVPRGVTNFPLQNRIGNAYMKISAEYAARVNDNLSLSLFYDAGNIWEKASDINPTRLLRGAGLGVTLVTPFGPLGLDYAYGFDKDRPGWQLHFKFGAGF